VLVDQQVCVDVGLGGGGGEGIHEARKALVQVGAAEPDLAGAALEPRLGETSRSVRRW